MLVDVTLLHENENLHTYNNMLALNYLMLIVITLMVGFAIFEVAQRGFDNRKREEESARIADHISSLTEAVNDMSCHLKAHGELLKMHGNTLDQVHEQMHIQDDAIRKLSEQVKQGSETGLRLEGLLKGIVKDRRKPSESND